MQSKECYLQKSAWWVRCDHRRGVGRWAQHLPLVDWDGKAQNNKDRYKYIGDILGVVGVRVLL